jgi:arylsulfatase A-like enzyme
MAAKAAEKKPNILFIMGDDVGWWQVVNRLPRAVGPFKENGEERVHRACRS